MAETVLGKLKRHKEEIEIEIEIAEDNLKNVEDAIAEIERRGKTIDQEIEDLQFACTMLGRQFLYCSSCDTIDCETANEMYENVRDERKIDLLQHGLRATVHTNTVTVFDYGVLDDDTVLMYVLEVK